MLERPSLLLVAQPDDALPGAKGEMKVIRALKGHVTVVDRISSEATPTSVLNPNCDDAASSWLLLDLADS